MPERASFGIAVKITGHVSDADIAELEDNFDCVGRRRGHLPHGFKLLETSHASVCEHAKLALGMGLFGVPIFFIFHAVAYLWAFSNWLQCSACLVVLLSSRQYLRFSSVVLFISMASQCLILVITIVVTVDMPLFFGSEFFGAVGSFGFPHPDPKSAVARLQLHILLEGLPRFNSSVLSSFVVFSVWLVADIGILLLLIVKLHRYTNLVSLQGTSGVAQRVREVRGSIVERL